MYCNRVFNFCRFIDAFLFDYKSRRNTFPHFVILAFQVYFYAVSCLANLEIIWIIGVAEFCASALNNERTFF